MNSSALDLYNLSCDIENGFADSPALDRLTGGSVSDDYDDDDDFFDDVYTPEELRARGLIHHDDDDDLNFD